MLQKGEIMAIIINLKEKDNHLSFAQSEKPIICGNDNYDLHIDFSSEWDNFTNKTAVFTVKNQNHFVDFEGDTCHIPNLPNADSLSIYIMAGNSTYGNIVTNSISIKLIATKIGITNNKFTNSTDYFSEIKTFINQIKNGTYELSFANKVSLTGDEDIAGIKNFTDNIKKCGVEILNKEEISNPNLLINGDFKINQRGVLSVTGTQKYVCDRWKTSAISSNATYNSSTGKWTFALVGNSTTGARTPIEQVIEDVESLRGKTVTLSIDVTEFSEEVPNSVTLAIYDGVTTSTPITGAGRFSVTRTIRNNATSIIVRIAGTNEATNYSVTPNYIKLEIGSVATTYSPRLCAEELTMCQRYYQKRTSGFAFSASALDRTPVMRIAGTTGITTINGTQYNYCDAEIY